MIYLIIPTADMEPQALSFKQRFYDTGWQSFIWLW